MVKKATIKENTKASFKIKEKEPHAAGIVQYLHAEVQPWLREPHFSLLSAPLPACGEKCVCVFLQLSTV